MASNEYRDLGMTRRIPRRDFLNGVAIAVAGAYVTGTRTAAAPSTLQAPPGAAPYPPARTGLRGNYPEAVAAFEPIQRGTYRQFPALDVDTRESYDLVIHDTLDDPDVPPEQRPHVIGRRRFGSITIANSDAGAAAFTNQAIDEAHRAVAELFVTNGLT